MSRRHRNRAGFTLIEMAIVVALFGLLLGGGLLGVGKFFDRLASQDTRNRLTRVERALATYVIQNGELPCADTDTDGLSNDTACSGAPSASVVQGLVPYRTLGLARDDAQDGWHNFISYLVTVDLATTSSALACGSGSVNYSKVMTDTPGQIEPLDDPATESWDASNPPRSAYALISHGENGFGAIGNGGGQIASGSASPNEGTNIAPNGTQTTNGPIEIGSAPTDDGFDDRVRVRTPAQILYDIGCNNDPAL
jgi:prepilin-type N-terminal cleavage/methylation domain-containing protein